MRAPDPIQQTVVDVGGPVCQPIKTHCHWQHIKGIDRSEGGSTTKNQKGLLPNLHNKNWAYATWRTNNMSRARVLFKQPGQHYSPGRVMTSAKGATLMNIFWRVQQLMMRANEICEIPTFFKYSRGSVSNYHTLFLCYNRSILIDIPILLNTALKVLMICLHWLGATQFTRCSTNNI